MLSGKYTTTLGIFSLDEEHCVSVFLLEDVPAYASIVVGESYKARRILPRRKVYKVDGVSGPILN